MDNIFSLHQDLKENTYEHGRYKHFRISDPKPRDIHKATVRDRLLHHAIYRKLYPLFDRIFIADSYSCRKGMGTHRAMNRFRVFAGKVSKNHTRTCYVLKCDIRKFFASIDHKILLDILEKRIPDRSILWLLRRVIKSFEGAPDKGLPLGNLTSQLLVNIYMNEFDHYVKHKVSATYYIRYADDFVVLSDSKLELMEIKLQVGIFLNQRLKLDLHPAKCSIKTYAPGVDFLGWVHFTDHRVLRTTTKRRMLKVFRQPESKPETLQSYVGLLSHGNTNKLQSLIAKRFSS